MGAAATYHRGRKGTVQPTPALTNQFRSGFWHICLSLARLDVGKGPPVAGFRNKLEAKNTILGQEHVLREDVHAVDTLGAETVREGVVTVEVLLERPAKDGAEAIR